LVTNPVLTVINSLAIYFIGHSYETIYSLSFVKANKNIYNIIQASSFVFPDFSKINYKPFIFYEKFYPELLYTQSYFYALFYILFLLTLSIFIFNKKSLE
jgi:hypothetical protein